MENAVDALKMAAAVLVFVIALGISISSFSEAHQTGKTLIGFLDRENYTQYIEDTGEKERIVSAETIVPTLYRAYKENYKILFYDKNGNPTEIYKIINNNGEIESINCIDLEQEVLGNDTQKDNFIMALLYGNKAKLKDENGNSINFTDFANDLKKNNGGITLNSEGIYDKILKNSTFLEKFGVYYQEELQNTNSSNTSGDDEFETVQTPDANKTTKRVISYFKQ